MSRTRAQLPALRRSQATLLALLILALGCGGTILLYQGLKSNEHAAVQRYAENLASLIQSDLLSDLSEQINAQERMATRLSLGGMDQGEMWESTAGLFLEHYPYYRSLATLAPDLTILDVHSRAPVDLVPGERFQVESTYRIRLEEAARNGEFVITRPWYLPDGMPGITFLTPIGQGEMHDGFLAAVLVIPDSIETMVSASWREEVSLHARHRGRDVYPFPFDATDAPDEYDAAFTLDPDEDGQGMAFQLALNPEARANLTTMLPVVVLVSGLLLSFLFALVVWLGISARGQARVLGESNRRLESEVREREQAEEDLAFLVEHDSLTGLPNRTGCAEAIEALIRRNGDSDDQMAVMFLDLDQFKDINDSLGHQLGDQLLCAVPQRLAGVLREQDLVGRHGGDEFLIAVVRESREQIEQLAGNILRVLDGGFAIDDHRLFISASIGIAYFPESGRTVDELIQNADTALFKAKNAGRNQFAVFTREMFAQAQHRLNLSRDIRHALEDGDFRVVYQPIVDVGTLELVGLETLLRWQHSRGYMVPPQEFIRVAEETGVIGRLGQFALDQALSDLAEWQQTVTSPPWIAVNVSGAQAHEAGFAEQLSVMLHQHRVAPDLLHIEITEEVLIENLLRNRRMLQKLDEIGMRIVVDDFGVGYSSLAYLKNFPISVVKIDRGFVRDLSVDPEDQAITRTICGLSRELGMRTVAEGVEQMEQLELLRQYQCTHAQGFLFSRPVERVEVQAMIEGDYPWSGLMAKQASRRREGA
ncbi:EAL domain-containing protein [Wenzhouxiangella sp. AB-CW3]|uniref:putative bifunctional diguanylate cyclase/phosphodiesterase n=1 Tax=Wenzhouxiangella sp. AB-CW3 TaxID=2771012 RepID=UPI00168A48AC|nr:EAL domain-containing protein [Wenzhouxiangella sp. AB-CW3]QOC22203.1 EAL domain-containing protein [Wenzhouxiangella sp. AB-CW3]